MRDDLPPPPYSGSSKTTAPELALALVADPTTHDVLISIIPPKEPLDELGIAAARAPMDICCVIDVSGSMGEELKAMMEEGKDAERTGLSALDVVKHAVRTIVATMEPNDRISIVSFSTTSEIVAGLTPMTDAGKGQVLNAIEKLHPLQSTNIWDGLKTGMNVLNELEVIPSAVASKDYTPASSRIRTLFLLTDGKPNINPPRGTINMLQSYIDANPLKFSIHTFGFGYSLDSQLLLQIARHGNGAFGFIPDATSLGAVFIHAVANLYATCADKVELSIEYPGDGATSGLDVSGCEGAVPCSWGAKINVGLVQYGQTRDFIIKIKDHLQVPTAIGDSMLSVTAHYRPWTHRPQATPETCNASLSHHAVTGGGSEDSLINLKYHVQRFAFISAVDAMFLPGQKKTTSVREAVAAKFQYILSPLRSPPLSNHSPGCALAEDIAGEGLLALSSNEVCTRWGQHYLPSLARFHLLQQCGSFRDPGLQVYGAESPLFKKYREALDKTFDTLPPPTPSVVAGFGANASTQNHSMAARFSRRSGPCFDGTCEVALGGGQKMLVRDLRRGLRVETPRGLRTVVAVLETRMDGGTALLCELPGGLKITPWHPIKAMSGRWDFPANGTTPALHDCHAVYSILLEPDADPDAHSVYVQDVLCVTLGHGITHPHKAAAGIDVRTHPFLGHYESIVCSLASFPCTDVDEGLYRIRDTLKDVKTDMICGFVPYTGSTADSGAFVDQLRNNGVQIAA